MLKIRENWGVNFEQLPRLSADNPFTEPELSLMLEESTRWLLRNTALFKDRVRKGRIRNGHGDLRLEHLYLTTPWSTIDPLTFNPYIRFTDVANDVSYLAMELEAAGRPDASAYLLKRYAEITNDDTLLDIAPFFMRYLAVVRAKVTGIRVTQLKECKEWEALKKEARHLAELALNYKF